MSRKTTEEEQSSSGCDVIRAWFARQPRAVKIVVCAIGAMFEGDRGNAELAAEIVAGFEADLLAEVQDPRSDVVSADMAMIEISIGMEAVQGRWEARGPVRTRGRPLFYARFVMGLRAGRNKPGRRAGRHRGAGARYGPGRQRPRAWRTSSERGIWNSVR